MQDSELLQATDAAVKTYDEQLDVVLEDLNKRLLDIVGDANGADGVDADTILASGHEFEAALIAVGFYIVAGNYLATYTATPGLVKDSFAQKKLPPPVFTEANRAEFVTTAKATLEGFDVIGKKALDDLRLNLYRQAVGEVRFSEMVESVRAATVGVDGKGSPLKNYSYTHANSAHLSFSGEVLITAGESIGAEDWEVTGPLDDVTRDVCVAALSDPIRTKEEWQDAGYWGTLPGGWSCRHSFSAYIPDVEDD